MERHTHQRRMLASPDLNPPSDSMDPTLEKQQKPTSSSTNTSRPISKTRFYMINNLSKLSLDHRMHNPKKHQPRNPPTPPTIDIHLQPHSMNVSADSDSSFFSLVSPNSKPPHKTCLEKASRTTNDEPKKDLDMEKLHKEEQVSGKQKQRGKEGSDAKRISVSLARRQSFCGTQVELADILASCGVKTVSVDMPPFMQIHAVDCARKTYDSLEKFTSKTLALALKKEFDGVYGPAWHCIVGTSFGSFVTHSLGGFIYFNMDQKLYILLFKTTVQRAD